MEHIKGFISTERRPNPKGTAINRYVTFACPNCGTVEEKYYNKTNFVNLCSHCAKGGYTTAQFIEKCRNLFADKYDYSKTKYVNKRTAVTIVCPVHGEFKQKAQEHLSGNGCKKCATDLLKTQLHIPIEVWQKRLSKFKGITFKDVSLVNGYHDYVDFICESHGEFRTQLGSITQAKHLCPECVRMNHQTQSIRKSLIGKPAILYYVYLPDIDMYKLGVTVDLEQRIKSLGNCVVKGKKLMKYEDACALEHFLHTKLCQYRYTGTKKLIKGGSTELYKSDVTKQIKRALQE